jgi:hypothetical protein
MLQEGQIERSANSVVLVFGKDHVTTIVAALDSFQDVLGVILAVAIGLDRAGLLARRRSRERLAGVVRSDWVVRAIGRRDLGVALLHRRSKRCGCKRKREKLSYTHCVECAVMSGWMRLREPVPSSSCCRPCLMYLSQASFRRKVRPTAFPTGDEAGETLPTMRF